MAYGGRNFNFQRGVVWALHSGRWPFDNSTIGGSTANCWEPSLCAVLAVAYSSNLLVAHYRDALGGSDPDNASAAALTAWLANPVNPLRVSGVESLWLLGLGVVFTIMGLIDGFLFEDPYPGYGRFYIEHSQRQADYQSLFQKSFDDLRDVEQKQDSHLAGLADEINKRLNDFLLLKARYASKPEIRISLPGSESKKVFPKPG